MKFVSNIYFDWHENVRKKIFSVFKNLKIYF